jgi:hypothetical protein
LRFQVLRAGQKEKKDPAGNFEPERTHREPFPSLRVSGRQALKRFKDDTKSKSAFIKTRATARDGHRRILLPGTAL